MGDMYLEMPLDREMIQEKKLARMQREIAELENRIHENVRLRHKLEDINDAEKDRAERMIDKMKDRHMVLKDEIDRIYKHSKSPVVSPFPSQLVEDVISRRTKEFSELQQQKTMQTKFLMAEKQRLQIAQDRLRQKRLSLQRLPTPDGKMTRRYWGQKYDIYTPLTYDTYFDIYSPVFEDGYYTYFPQEYSWLRQRYPEEEYMRHQYAKAQKGRGRKRKVLYVPRPLYESSSW